jgi:hypothetical protein
VDLEINSLSIIKTKYGSLNLQEDDEQKCLHIWVSHDDDPKIEVDCNHIRIRSSKTRKHERQER